MSSVISSTINNPNFSRGFELIIKCNIPRKNYDTENEISLVTTYLHLDMIEERSVESSVKLATQPLYNGDTLIDHMYRDPDKYTVSGKFSLMGANATDPYDYVDGTSAQGDRLKNIQTVFEYIKNNGILCDLLTFAPGDNGNTRFKERKNMALERCSFSEFESSMSYTFTFTEVISVNWSTSQIKITQSFDTPNIQLPEARSLGEVMYGDTTSDFNIWDEILISGLCAKGYIDETTVAIAQYFINKSSDIFIQKLFSEIANYNNIFNLKNTQTGQIWAGAGVGYLIGAGTASVGVAAVAIAGGAAAATGPVGWVVGVCALVIVGLWTAIGALYEAGQIEKLKFNLITELSDNLSKLKIEDVRKFKNGDMSVLSKLNLKFDINEITRLHNFLNTCKIELNTLSRNTKFYQLTNSVEDNDDRVVALTVGGIPYYITIKMEPITYNDITDDPKLKKVKVIAGYNIKLSVQTIDSNGNKVNINGTNGSIYNTGELTKYCTTMDDTDMTTSNCIFRDSSNLYEVYLYNPNRNAEYILVKAFEGVNEDLNITSMKDYNQYDPNEYSLKLAAKMKELDNEYSKLYYYQLVVSYGPFTENKNRLVETICDFIKNPKS